MMTSDSTQLQDTDAQLRDSVQQALQQSGYAELGNLEIDVDDGRVTLSGRVSSYYLKQVAQSRSLGLDGVRLLSNRVTIQG